MRGCPRAFWRDEKKGKDEDSRCLKGEPEEGA